MYSKECKKVKNKWCCNGEDLCPDRENIYNFLDIYSRDCVIRRYKKLTKIFSPYWENPDLHGISWQFLVSERQYKLGMIPHHSMAIHMSKKLLEKENNIKSFVENIIYAQEKEIEILKQR